MRCFLIFFAAAQESNNLNFFDKCFLGERSISASFPSETANLQENNSITHSYWPSKIIRNKLTQMTQIRVCLNLTEKAHITPTNLLHLQFLISKVLKCMIVKTDTIVPRCQLPRARYQVTDTTVPQCQLHWPYADNKCNLDDSIQRTTKR